MEETLHRNRSVQLCSLQCRIKMPILALSQKRDISEMFLGKVDNVLGLKLFFVTGLVIFATAVARLVCLDLLGWCLAITFCEQK